MYMSYTIECEGVTKAFGAVPVLTGLDLRVSTGSVFALLGPNGAGKTTTVRILSTLLLADGGRALVARHDVGREAEAVRRLISLTGQYAAVDETLTGRENLLLMGRLRHLRRRAARSRTVELLEQFDLAEAADRRVSTYSGGMRRRLDIAMSLVSEPRVLFLDEPTTGLDPRSRRDVWDAVTGLKASGVTVLLTTQYLEEADRLADRIAVIDGGQAIAEGTAEELKARVGSETVELFFDDVQALGDAALVLDGAPVDLARLSLRVATNGSAASVRDLLDRVDGVVRLDVHRPTLDEAFLALTERTLA
jgi:ABC-2 type transport system ATP-binding protein